MKIMVLLIFIGLISQKSLSQESVSVTADDSMRFRVEIKKSWYKKDNSIHYPNDEKHIYVDFGSVNDPDKHAVNFYWVNKSKIA